MADSVVDRQRAIAHLALLDMPTLLAACQDQDYSRRTRDMVAAAAQVLTEERMTESNLVERLAVEGDAMRINIGDLNTEGFAFATSDFQKWLSGVDRMKPTRTCDDVAATLRRRVAKFRERNCVR